MSFLLRPLAGLQRGRARGCTFSGAHVLAFLLCVPGSSTARSPGRPDVRLEQIQQTFFQKGSSHSHAAAHILASV